MVVNTEGGDATKSHGFGGSRGDASQLSVVVIIPGVSDFPPTPVLKNKCPAHHREVAFSTSVGVGWELLSSDMQISTTVCWYTTFVFFQS